MNRKKSSLLGIFIWPFLCLLAAGALILVERSGIPNAQEAANATADVLLAPKGQAPAGQAPDLARECLLLYDPTQAHGDEYRQNLGAVLESMCVGYDALDLSKGSLPPMAAYRTAIVAMPDFSRLGERVFDLFAWVEGGGRLLVALTPQPSPTFFAVSHKLGILQDDVDYRNEDTAQFLTDLMPGGKGRAFHWSDGDRAGLDVRLSEDCTVHMATADSRALPMLWERAYGAGRIVVNNNDALNMKDSRGLAAAAYSLLQDAFAYPVINASVFFIDDFPAPVPEGYNEYIYRNYKCDIDTYYTTIWYPAMKTLADKHGLRYTGLLIETYGDGTKAPFAPNAKAERMRYFGELLLSGEGEMGAHGYNHMSLVPEHFDYKGKLDYKKWPSTADMEASLRELYRFAAEEFPSVALRTYVPPSNVLSDEARAMLREKFPQINCISGVYTNSLERLEFEQEFDVSPDGIVNLPRIISGCQTDDYFYWIAMSELSFHYVNSHFLHPDDALDPDRGADIGWDKLRSEFDGFLTWLYDSAKGLRNLTAQQAAAAVARYDALTVSRSQRDGSYAIDLGGFAGEAYLLLRVNDGRPGAVSGGSIEPVCGNLYLLRAQQSHVSVAIVPKEQA